MFSIIFQVGWCSGSLVVPVAETCTHVSMCPMSVSARRCKYDLESALPDTAAVDAARCGVLESFVSECALMNIAVRAWRTASGCREYDDDDGSGDDEEETDNDGVRDGDDNNDGEGNDDEEDMDYGN